jgi:hypothetical protein
MSVINKMLRDLDHRQAAQTPLASGGPDASQGVAPQTPLRQGTASIGRASGASRSQSRRWIWIGLFGLVAAVGVAGWFWMEANPGSFTGEVASAPVVATPAPSVASAPTAVVAPVAAVATPPESTPSAPGDSAVTVAAAAAEPNVAPGAMVLRMEQSLSARRALDALLSTPAPSVVASPRVPAPTPTHATVPTPNRPPTALAAKAPAAAPVESPPAVQRQQQAGGDAIAQAQNLWNTGSHDAAIDLMQQSIAVAERAAKSGGGANAGSVLVPLVREMARMQLAEGRFGAVWEMLTRLELQLGNQADLWAIRANAAQRLGRHQDSVHAYMVALQSRPDEQRWLLGAAVSLAALGQTSSAAEMAEKARAVGPISKDILAYLRQAGVVFKD